MPERQEVLDGVPVTEHRMDVAGTGTAVLVGGDGPPMVLLPGPGESALWWVRVLPELAARHRVVAPDLPGTGASDHFPGGVTVDGAVHWLDALISRTCQGPPVIVGHVVGGALAAQYALRHPENVERLVLVDTLGLRRFFPSPGFGFRLMRFLAKPGEERFEPFLGQCMMDAGGVKQGLGDKWQPFLQDYLAGVQDPRRKDAMGQWIKHFGAKPIAGLERLQVPVTLVWGRHDKATPLKVAQRASQRHGWPLHVVERSGDDPKLERPREFLEALRRSEAPVVTQ